MATLVLQTVGSVVGAAVGGPIGAAVGQAIGAIGGSYLDQQIFGAGDQTVTGPRLDNARILSSNEGAPIARVYGRSKVSGEIIWATRFEEVESRSSRSQGGKGGGPKTTIETYAYFANFAIGLCEGEIGGIRRIWADGREVDQTALTIRVHTGTADQQPDSLIEAKQGVGNAPAYRGLAYLVFEGFPLEAYGNRIPQISVEVVRPIGTIERHVFGVNLIPGATEFGYDTEPVADRPNSVTTRRLNVNQLLAETDFLASLDDLIAACPNLQQIALVVAWFGNDLRAQHCRIEPRVETASRSITTGADWRVAGLGRGNAQLVSQIDGRPAFGGTPSDKSVLNAIAEIKARGLKVCIHPFVMMDVPPESGLPNPDGQGLQPAYPWRGRITCDPAPLADDSVDQTAAAAAQLAQFAGSAQADDIFGFNQSVIHESHDDWGYRRFILHYARLAELAGGVDMFLLGSELRGLTRVRDDQGQFPFVSVLEQLAQDVRPILGAECTLTYGADWSEYFGYHPQDGSGDVWFNLDALWASSAIDAVGIDNYMPLSDWREDGTSHDGARHANDRSALRKSIASGEGFDWYYHDEDARDVGNRSPITDGQGKPWVFRYKDIASWWSNQHFNRPNGIEESVPTAWQPMSKPIVFTEFGAPAVHNAATRPNAFPDKKSSEDGLPHFSTGGRDDDAQAAFIEAHQGKWSSTHPDYQAALNPISSTYDAPMVDFSSSLLWAWDARPWPAFPQNGDVWSDGQNWTNGHWLNGRLGGVRIADLIKTVLSEAAFEGCDVSRVTGMAEGYVIADGSSPRQALDILIRLYRLAVYETDGVLHFVSPGVDGVALIDKDARVFIDGAAIENQRRDQASELPSKISLRHLEASQEYAETDTDAQRANTDAERELVISAPLSVDRDTIAPIVDASLEDIWTARDRIEFALPWSHASLTVGDVFTLEGFPHARRWRINEIEESDVLRIFASANEPNVPPPKRAGNERSHPASPELAGPPAVHFMDLPYLTGRETVHGNRIAAATVPWPGTMAVYASPAAEDYSFRQGLASQATIGDLETALLPCQTFGRWNWSDSLSVTLLTGQFASANSSQVLTGANAVAVGSHNTGWEVIQFREANLIGANRWELRGLLRGQAGTEDEAERGASMGATLVLLDAAVPLLEIDQDGLGLALKWMVGKAGRVLGDKDFTKVDFTPGHRLQRPFRPVHFQAYTNEEGITFSWIRRDRLAADDWSAVEIPMSEANEAYELRLHDANGVELTRTVAATSSQVTHNDIQEAFGSEPGQLTASIAQLSQQRGAGSFARLSFVYP